MCGSRKRCARKLARGWPWSRGPGGEGNSGASCGHWWPFNGDDVMKRVRDILIASTVMPALLIAQCEPGATQSAPGPMRMAQGAPGVGGDPRRDEAPHGGAPRAPAGGAGGAAPHAEPRTAPAAEPHRERAAPAAREAEPARPAPAARERAKAPAAREREAEPAHQAAPAARERAAKPAAREREAGTRPRRRQLPGKRRSRAGKGARG